MKRSRLWLLLVVTATRLPAQTKAALLAPNIAVEGDLAAGQSTEYEFVLQAGQYGRFWINQKTINIAVTLFAPSGAELYQGDAARIGEVELADLIADMGGTYRIRITAPEPAALPGRYDITLRDLQPATEQLKHRVAGNIAFAKANEADIKESNEERRKSLHILEDSLTDWRAAGDLAGEAKTLYTLGLFHLSLGDKQNALDFSQQGLEKAKAAGNRVTEAWALDYVGQVHENFGDRRLAAEYYEKALLLRRAAGDRNGEGNTLNNLGMAYARLGEKRKALDYFSQSVAIFQEAQDLRNLAALSSNMGVIYGDLGDSQLGLESHLKALEIQHRLGNRAGEASTLNNIGTTYLELSEYQKAIDALQSAVDLNRDRPLNTAINLSNLGRAYAGLGDRAHALDFFGQSIKIQRELKFQWGLAHTLNYVGEIYNERGEYQKALEYHSEALSFALAVGDPDMEGLTLGRLGNCYVKVGDRHKANGNLSRAVALLRSSGNQRMLAESLRDLGALQRENREFESAAEHIEEALQIGRLIRDRAGEAAALAEMARLERGRGNISLAQQRAGEALVAYESVRLRVMSPKLRASFLASVRKVQELNIDMLAELHARHIGESFAAAALDANERGRARSLLDLLGESRAQIRQGVDAALLDRERQLQRTISEKAERQIRLLAAKHTAAEAAGAAKELQSLDANLEQVQSRIRATSPQYAALTQPTPLDLGSIQSRVLDENTVLLEYALGTEHSYLWSVTTSGIELFQLPPRAEVESVAKPVYQFLSARGERRAGAYAERAEASRMLLGPVAATIRNKRLLIVAEGVLQYLPFAALPDPESMSTPLIVNHEIVTAPSASVIGVLRQESILRKPAEKELAILADPVFSTDDPRIVRKTRPAADRAAVPNTEQPNTSGKNVIPLLTRGATSPRTLPRSCGTVAPRVSKGTCQKRQDSESVDTDESYAAARSANGQDFVRLRFSRSEAEEIARLAAPGDVLKALDFDASRETVLRPDFGSYRIVHFATHSLLNNEHPELSGVVLSLVDREGHAQNGFLRLYDIYNLRLSSDLVVLSACQTALGGEIGSEGLIGLTRGFLYAGTPRVVASLWETDDRATAELMKRFYESMLARNERPAAALRAAQISMWKTKGWDSPYLWASFTLQGEWR